MAEVQAHGYVTGSESDPTTGLVRSVTLTVLYPRGEARLHIHLETPIDGRMPLTAGMVPELEALRDALHEIAHLPGRLIAGPHPQTSHRDM
jgi:hypothetical protein